MFLLNEIQLEVVIKTWARKTFRIKYSFIRLNHVGFRSRSDVSIFPPNLERIGKQWRTLIKLFTVVLNNMSKFATFHQKSKDV